jgi:hypothetical protein
MGASGKPAFALGASGPEISRRQSKQVNCYGFPKTQNQQTETDKQIGNSYSNGYRGPERASIFLKKQELSLKFDVQGVFYRLWIAPGRLLTANLNFFFSPLLSLYVIH